MYENWFVTVDMYVFANTDKAPTVEETLMQLATGQIDNENKLAPFSQDDFIQIEVVRYF